MNVFAVLALCSFISYSVIGFFVIHLDSRRLLNKLFLIYSVCAAIYSFAEFGYLQAESAERAEIWLKVRAFWVFPFAIILHSHLVYTKQKGWLASKWVKFLIYFPAFFLFFFDLFTYKVTGHAILKGDVYSYDPPLGSWLYHASGMYGLVYILIMTTMAAITWIKRESRLIQAQAGYLLVADLMVVLVVLLNTFIIKTPAFEHLHIDSLFLIISNLILAYAIWRFRFLHITPEVAARNIIDVMSNFMILINPDGKISEVNEATEKLTGYKSEELEGQLFSFIFNMEKEMGITLFDVLKPIDKLVIKNRKGSLIPKSREPIPVLFSISTVTVKGFREQGLVCTGSELTEIKEAQVKLAEYAFDVKKSNDFFQQIFHSMSHDLSESLRLIRTFTYMLGNSLKDHSNSKVESYMDIISAESGLMHDKIKGLVEFSELGKNFEQEEVDFEEILKKTLVDMADTIGQSGADITIESLPRIRGDKLQIKKLFTHLISNAIKFTREEKPEIQIKAEKNELGEWIFAIKDNGIGISSEYHKKIFSLFNRLNDRDDYPGVGIGLPICKKIIEQHHGDIWVESEEGTGSIFYFTLPDIPVKRIAPPQAS